jgi:hypothetical protein
MDIKKSLFLMLHLGWIFPKVNLGFLNLGVQEISALLIIILYLKIEISFLKFFFLEIFYAFVIILIGLGYFIKNQDFYGLFLGVRLMLFTLAILSIDKKSNYIENILKYCVKFCFVFVLFSILFIALSFGLNGFNIIDFLYGSGYNKIRAPFEGDNAASSQIPIGILLAILSVFPKNLLTGLSRKYFIIGTFLTTSRAAILGYISAVIFNSKSRFFYKVIIFLSGALFLFVKTFSQGGYSNTFDGSSNVRLKLWSHAITFYSEHPYRLLFGNGIGSRSLFENTGFGFYESSIVNSLMQGGVPLMTVVLFIFFRNIVYDRKFKLEGISFLLLFANSLGGDNYFSMYSYPITLTYIIYRITLTSEVQKNEGHTHNNYE